MGRKGITLVELIVVLTVVMLLVASLGYSYEGWQRNYEIEIATREPIRI